MTLREERRASKKEGADIEELADFGVPATLTRALRIHGILTLEVLKNKTKEDLLKLPGISFAKVYKIEVALRSRGYTLRTIPQRGKE